MASQGGNTAYAPYVGDANPITAMASDLHNAYLGAASTYDTANPTKSNVSVALAGDAWVSAIDMGIAQQNPFLSNEPVGQIDLWDSNPLLACCVTPIGYHPSVYGDYLDAVALFDQITGLDAATINAEFEFLEPALCQLRFGRPGDIRADRERSCSGSRGDAAGRSAGACAGTRLDWRCWRLVCSAWG